MEGPAMQPLRHLPHEERGWVRPTIISFKLTAEELSGIENASDPRDALVKVYRARRSQQEG
jgi:hypothetical protein